MSRFSPVVLIAGAASAMGEACAQAIGAEATGGLLLADGDEISLGAVADALARPPERVSTLVFDIADPARWGEAGRFMQAQYGRLDWVLVCLTPDQKGAAKPGSVLEIVRAVAPLMAGNSMGGALTLLLSARAVKIDALLRLVRIAAKEGDASRVRVNAVLDGAIDSPLWRRDPVFEALAAGAGGETAALVKLERLSPPLARCAQKQDLARLALLLLGDEANVSGVTLVAEPGAAL
jgi:NAD(P)-dependent dehydrogenase (short-subunit alcohol dehydrogenase family)